MLSRTDLTRQQLAAIQHIKRHPKSAVWMGLGLGKTASTLTAFSDALHGFESRRMLTVAPKRVARDVWHAEVDEWAHLQGLTVSRIVGTRNQRLAAIRKPTDIHTINRENLRWLFGGYVEEVTKSRFRQIRKWGWDWLTLDESQSYRNASSTRSKIAHRISTFGLPQRIVELTGTPAPKGYAGLWSQLFILDHGQRLGRTEDAFLDRWFDPPADYGLSPTLKAGAEKEIQSLISDICLSIPDDAPPIPFNPIRVSLPAGAMQQYRKLEREALLEIDPHTITAVNAGVLWQKLLQLASGAVYTDDQGNYQTLHTEKVDRLYELLDELAFTGPVVVAYGFIHEAKRIGAALTKYCQKGQRWSTLRSESELAAFQRGEIDFGLIHPASGGHGLNALYRGGCKDMIWIGPTPDLELWDQLNARIAGGHRRGAGCRIHVLLASGTVDDDAMDMLRGRQADQAGLLRAKVLQAKNAL